MLNTKELTEAVKAANELTLKIIEVAKASNKAEASMALLSDGAFLTTLFEGLKGIQEIKAETKDLTTDEIKDLVTVQLDYGFKIVKAIKG